jgi:glycosyltransferase involved in cell wall biosynthesis
MQPLVTIITVTYNAANIIEETVLSVLSQSYSNYEYLLIDGASKDDTLNRIARYEKKIKILSEPDDGIYDAMNKGIALAKGEWIYFLNAGDLFYDNRVLDDIFNQSFPEDVMMIYGKVRTRNHPSGIDLTIGNPVVLKDFYYHVALSHQAVFSRAGAFRIIGNYNSALYRILADQEWFVRFFKKNLKAVYIDRIIAWYESEGMSSIQRRLNHSEHNRMVRLNFPGSVILINRLRDPFIRLKIFILSQVKNTTFYYWYRKIFFSDQK